MGFLPMTLIVTLIRITTLVLIWSGELLLRASGADNNMVDGRFYWEDSNCPQNWRRQMELEPEVERPSLELWSENDTILLGGPSLRVIHMGEEYQTKDDFGAGTVKMVCKAPYPVILLAAYEDEKVSLEEEVFHVTTTDIYNKSSYTFETQTWFRLPPNSSPSNLYYCQAVKNPCLKSTGKLLYFNDKSTSVISFTLRVFSLSSGFFNNYSDSNSDSDSNSHLNPNSSSISPLEKMPIFGSTLDFDLNQRFFHSSSKYQNQDQHNDTHSNTNNNTNDSECEAFFYYEEFRDEADPRTEGRINLRYRCEFSDGTPGTVQIFRRCSSWGRCRFLVAANQRTPKSKVKNCWRPYTPQKTCLNCTAQNVGLFGSEPFIPHCTTQLEEGEADQKDGNGYSVEGTPLYVGFPPTGFKIQGPFIRTDAYDEDDLEESTLVRMKPIPEIQLLNTTIEVTCESIEWYTPTIFIFALQFQSKSEKGEEVHKNLQFFSVDKTGLKHRDYGNGYFDSQTVTVHLNRTDLTRIFCFAGVQNSYTWNNSSRAVRVLEYRDFYKPSECLDSDPQGTNEQHQLPRLELMYLKPTGGVNRTDISRQNPELLINAPVSTLSCFANYPIQVFSTFDTTSKSRKSARQTIKFDTFRNYSNYLFTLAGIEVHPKREDHFYRCQSLENPCLHQSISYSYSPGSPRRQKFEHVPQSDDSYGSGSSTNEGLEFGSPANYPECEVLFFYKELEDFPGYEFRCEFPLEDTGKVNFHYCDSLNDCANLYRNRRQSKVCVRKVKSWRSCRLCKESRAVSYRPFVATCEITRNIYSYPNFDYKGLRVKESAFGNFAVFGLPNKTNGIAPIYFSNEEIDSKATLFLEPFEKYQLLNTSLNVTCVSSAYYMSIEDVHIAKFYGERNELQLLEFDGYNSDKFKVDPEQHEWRITRNIELGKDTGLTHIFCIGITWTNIRKHINSSREVHLQDPEGPKIILDAGNFYETSSHLNGAGNRQMSLVDQEHEFLVNSENQTLDCHAYGFPPPKIQWETTAQDAPKPEETQVNSSYIRSRIFLPLIHIGVNGTYFCTAMNSQGKATASLKVVLKYPVNKSMVAIVTTSIFMFIGLSIIMALLWKRNRGLKKMLRDLTQDEVEEFHLGSRSVNPDDPLAEIYALPYDWSLEVPRELIELDETNILGSGQFGLVRSGYFKKWQDVTGKDEKKLVAIKQAKPKLGVEEFKNILSEIKVMSHLKEHENVLQILAACTTSIKKCQVLIVMEFCEMGDLLKYLRDRKYIFEDIFTPRPDPTPGTLGYVPVSTIVADKLSTHTLIDFSLGIAKGMSFLRQKKVVHGDLAARNILLTKTLEVKVSDFGCSTQLINYASYTKNEQAIIPWRWFSVEALKEMKLSFKSDVWAFGVLLYEIFTLGELPYSGYDFSVEFIQDLADGKRLEQPDFTNDEIYALMTDCWQKDPRERPTFQEIHDRLLLIKNELS